VSADPSTWAQNAPLIAVPDQPVRIKFGPAPHQEIRAEVAEAILSAWRVKAPKTFGDYLRKALLDGQDDQP
jgi:hypothetical protein